MDLSNVIIGWDGAKWIAVETDACIRWVVPYCHPVIEGVHYVRTTDPCPERAKFSREIINRMWADPAAHERHSEQMRQRYKDPEYVARVSASLRIALRTVDGFVSRSIGCRRRFHRARYAKERALRQAA